MASRFDERVSGLAARWIAGVERRPGRVLLLTLVLTVGLGVWAVRNLGVNADLDALIDPGVDFRVRQEDFERSFRAIDTSILILVEADSAPAAGRAADALAERLARRSDLFERVIPLGGGDFFQRNALLFLSPQQLDALTDRLSRIQPFLAEIARDPSVVGISELLAHAVARARAGDAVPVDLSGALDRVSGAVEAAAALERGPDPWGDALVGGSLSESAKRRVISLRARPDYDYGALLFAEPAVRAIRDAARELELDAEHGFRIRITGDEILSYEEQQVIATQAQRMAFVALALFGVSIWFGVRSVRVVLCLVGSLVVALVWTNAFAAATVGELNQVSAAFNVLIVGLGGEFGIHVCMRYAELCKQGASRSRALEETGRSIGSSLVSSAGTTAIGFLVFVPTRYWAVAQLGLISGAGVLLSLVASLTVLPALLRLLAPEGRWLARLEHWPVTHARAIRIGAALLFLASIAVLPRVRFEINPLDLRDPSTESVQAFEAMLEHSGTSPWTVDVVAPDLERARALARRIDSLPGVEETRTLHDFVPEAQEEKRALLEDLALILPPTPAAVPARSPEEERAALETLERELVRTAEAEDAAPALRESSRRLAEAIRAFLEGPARTQTDAAFGRLEQNVVGSLPEQLAEFERAVAPDEITLAALPEDVREQMLADDGRARVQVIASEDLSEDVVLERFVETVREVAPDATGPAVDLLEWARVTSGAMRQAMVSGLVATTVFLLLLWRNLWDTVLAMFPILLAGAVACATMVLLGLGFNFANVIVLPMLLGMGIDNGIHLVHRHRTNPEEVDVLHTSTARAVFYAALTTVLCFGSLALAPHRGMAAVGQLLTLGVAATFLSYVVVLPAVLEWDDRRAGRRASRARKAAETQAAE